MKITLDQREHDLHEKIIQIMKETPSNVHEITYHLLQIGDILIQTDDLKDVILIERKTLKDLLASIKDGRYDEQSHRLIHSSGFPTHNIIYIIEGPLNTLKTLAERKLVYSCITSLNFFKGFSVLRTSSLQETAELIMQMADKIGRNFLKGSLPCHQTNENIEEEEKKNLLIIVILLKKSKKIILQKKI